MGWGRGPGLPRDVVVLGVVAFFVMLGFGVVVPVLPVYVRSFGVGYFEVGAVVSAFAVMRLVANPFVGKLIDLGGERIILATGIGIVALSAPWSGSRTRTGKCSCCGGPAASGRPCSRSPP